MVVSQDSPTEGQRASQPSLQIWSPLREVS